MKKHKKIFGFILAVTAITIITYAAFSPSLIPTNTFIGDVPVGGLSKEQAYDTLKQRASQNKVTLRLSGKVSTSSYGDMGVSIEVDKALASTQIDSRFGMASLFSLKDAKQMLIPDVQINEKMLKRAILSLSPLLHDPEETAPQFFVRSEKQEKMYTFNIQKIARQLTYNAQLLRGSDIEIELVPHDVEEPSKTPEEIQSLKKTLSDKTLTLRLEDDDIAKFEWKIDLKQPEWITENQNGVAVNGDLLKKFFKETIAPQIERPVQNAIVKSFSDEGEAAYAEVEGVARDGIKLPIDANIERVHKLTAEGVFDIALEIERTPGYVLNETGLALGYLELLGTGRSNFAGSPEGRTFNIRKGLREKFNNIIIPPGATFSYNKFMGPVTLKAGWKNALAIFGTDLKPVPGGGLCQVSTTVYRAALYAGLPIGARRSHSLYVKYYKEYGEGLDATVFQGGQDFTFVNDTPSYLFMQAYDDGDDAYVKIYGTSDGRRAELAGPYRTDTIPQEEKDRHQYTPRRNELAWHRTVIKADGTTVEEQIISRYRSLPR